MDPAVRRARFIVSFIDEAGSKLLQLIPELRRFLEFKSFGGFPHLQLKLSKPVFPVLLRHSMGLRIGFV